jgi:hypothetical protein
MDVNINKTIIQKKINSKSDNFISGFYIDSLICKNLIEYFKANKERHEEGKTLSLDTNQPCVNKNFKDSIDLQLNPGESFFEWDQYRDALLECAREYVNIFPKSNNTDYWNITERTNIQYYPPGGGFKEWHTERTSAYMPFVTRHLVFMTYLNDVKDQGETEFYHQKVKIKPETGLTLIWPADWTHTHRGIPSPTEEKYIITGWFNFLVKR